MGIGILIRISTIPNPCAPGVILLDQATTIIGRQGDIRMDTANGKEVSKKHTLIHRRMAQSKEIWIIQDNNSLNGTFVNGKKIHRIILTSGDEIVFGGGSQFHIGDRVQSTEAADCRYIFFIPNPPVHFLKSVDINATIPGSSCMDMCSICYSPIVAAETLPCGHQFCLSCIHEWSRVCIHNMRPCVCPLCRRPFSESELTPDDALITSNDIQVFSVEPLLRALGVKSCKIVKGANIFKVWKKKHHDWFWKSYNLVKDNDHQRAIFLHLTKVTVHYIFAANTSELQTAVCNLGGKVSDERGELLHELFLKIYYNLTPQKKSCACQNRSKRVRYF